MSGELQKFDETKSEWELVDGAKVKIAYSGYKDCKVDLGDGVWRKADGIMGATPSRYRFSLNWDTETKDCVLKTGDAEPVAGMIIEGTMENRNLQPGNEYELTLEPRNPLRVTGEAKSDLIYKILLTLFLLVAIVLVLEAARVTKFCRVVDATVT